MYLNLSSCLPNSKDAAQVNRSGSAVRSMLPVAPSSCHEPTTPVLRSKPVAYRGVPCRPDVAAMCKRRDASQISVRTLQRERGVEPAAKSAASLHAGMLDVYGYGQLADGLMWLSREGVALLDHVFRRLPDLPPWPPGCTATPAPLKTRALDGFIGKFSGDFEISLTPTALGAADMEGMIIVIGEDHFDPVIQGLVAEVMSEYRIERGDRFFMEGGEKEVCIRRTALYGIPVDACNLLEQGSTVFASGVKLARDTNQHLGKCAEYLIRHVPGLADTTFPSNDNGVLFRFVDRYASDLPIDAIPDYNELATAANNAIAVSNRALMETMGLRDESMSAALGRERSVTARNYAIVGSNHLAGMKVRMKDLPCIFMLPRQIAEEEVELEAKRETKEEL